MKSRTLLITCAAALCLCGGLVMPVEGQVPLVAEGAPRATVHVPSAAGELTRLAGQELVSYVRKLSGASLVQVGEGEAGKVGESWVLLGEANKNGAVKEALQGNGGLGAPLKAEGFVLRTGSWKEHPVVIVAGADDAGVLYGTYELLGRLGITFRLTGDILPEKKDELMVPRLDLRLEPALKRRGFLFPVNFDNASSYS
jgi:hypothetical protein